MRLLAHIATIVVILPLGVAGSLWTESGDAGDSLGTAQQTVGIGSLTQISGTIPTDADMDLFVINITNAATFAAWRYGAMQQNPDLWLFDLNGFGITYNDSVLGGQTALTGTSVPGPGLYYLGISNGGAEAGSLGGAIWITNLLVGERSPDGPGAAQPLSGWTSYGLNDGTMAYAIYLEGAGFSTAIPEPATAGLIVIGVLAILRGRRARRV